MTTNTEHLDGIIRDAITEKLRAMGNAESASIPMGDKRILIGPPSELARMLGYSDTLITCAATSGATRFWTGIDAAGHLARFWTKEPAAADYPALTIRGHVIMPLVREGDAAPTPAKEGADL